MCELINHKIKDVNFKKTLLIHLKYSSKIEKHPLQEQLKNKNSEKNKRYLTILCYHAIISCSQQVVY